MANTIQKRLVLEEREKQLHEQLTEETRQLQMARVRLKVCEEALEKTLAEIHLIHQEHESLTGIIEGMWNGPAGQRKPAVS
ncbi:MAG: hypothetical protein GY796_17400 [Chloroflexi bacterium]|nr:hypothetical protein [Chloroflexota bacterium]